MSQSRSRLSTPPQEGSPEERRRRPREGAGPCMPCGRLRPSLTAGGRARPLAAVLFIATTVACAALLLACGGTSDGGSSSPPSASPSAAITGASPSPMPSPQITSGPPPAGAVAVARQYWRFLSEDRFDAARSLLAPDSPLATDWPGTDALVRAHVVRAGGQVLAKSLKAAETVQFPVKVYVVPKFAVGNWDGPGVYAQYMGFVRMSDGSWRVFETGTGP
jgi:hypothetical protein